MTNEEIRQVIEVANEMRNNDFGSQREKDTWLICDAESGEIFIDRHIDDCQFCDQMFGFSNEESARDAMASMTVSSCTDTLAVRRATVSFVL